MITLKNTTTGETINVSNTNARDGKIIGRYEFGKRYYNKYTMLTRIGSEGEQPILQLAEGWEIVTSERAPRTQRQSTPAPQPSNEETPTELYKAYTEGGLFMLDELDASELDTITQNSWRCGYGAAKNSSEFNWADFPSAPKDCIFLDYSTVVKSEVSDILKLIEGAK